VKVTYEELNKYFSTRAKPSPYPSDLFVQILEDLEGSEELVGTYFILDRAHLKDTFYTKEGVEFSFFMEKKEEVCPFPTFSKFDKDLEQQHLSIQKSLEESSMCHSSSLLDGIMKSVKEKLGIPGK
jgi:hypothetical protein